MSAPTPPVPYQSPPRRVPRGAIIAIVVLAVLAAALGGAIIAREMSAETGVALEPVGTTGTAPFMDPVGVDVPDVRPVANTGGRRDGTSPGLYGSARRGGACDRGHLTRTLAQHPDRAAGFASVLGLRDASTTTISRYVDELTSVVLRSDTFVTNHGWVGGRVHAWPAVLQAGTAVLVDRYGNPVVRCACGNPLAAPRSYSSIAYIGPRWTSFSSNSVTVINHQTTTVTNNYTTVDVHTGHGHRRPVGTDGGRDVTVNVSITFPPPAPEPEESENPEDPADQGPPAGDPPAEETAEEPAEEGEGSSSVSGAQRRAAPAPAGPPAPATLEEIEPGAETGVGPTTDTTTSTTTTTSTPNAPSGMLSADGCDLDGPVVLGEDHSFKADSSTGTWSMDGPTLTLSHDVTDNTFDLQQSDADPTTWTGEGCTLTQDS